MQKRKKNGSILRAIHVIIIFFLGTILSDVIKPISIHVKQNRLLILLVIIGYLIAIWKEVISKETLEDTGEQKEKQIEKMDKKQNSFKLNVATKRKPGKAIKIIGSLLARPFCWTKRLVFGTGLPMLIICITWLGFSYFFDFKWDDPGTFSQVVQLSNPLGIKKNTLTLSWHHFGKIKKKQIAPKTILTFIGYEDSMMSILEFEKKYFSIEPDTLPRNNLKMEIKPVNSILNIQKTLDKLAINNYCSKISSSIWSPTVYSIYIKGKTSESEHSFIRRFNFRTRSLAELLLYYVLFGCFLVFAFFFINVPGIIKALRHNSYIANILNRIRLYLIRLLENSMYLDEPVSKNIELIEVTLLALIKIEAHPSIADYQETISHLNQQANAIVRKLKRIDDLTSEFDALKKAIESLLQDVENFHLNRLIEAETKEDFDIIIYAIINARFEINKRAKQIETEIVIQDETLEKRRTLINEKIKALKQNHEERVEKRKKEIEDQIFEKLPKVLQDINKILHPDTSITEVLDAKKFRTDFESPDLNEIEVILKRGDIIIPSKPKEPILKEETIIAEMIPIQKIQKKIIIEEDEIVYNVILDKIKASEKDDPEAAISLRPKSPEDEAKLSNFYKELSIEDIKNSNLSKISEKDLSEK